MKRLRSVLTDDMDHCIECGKIANHIHHCLYGNKRKQCDEDRLVVPLCYKCHHDLHEVNSDLALKYKQLAQMKYEEINGHERYMQRYGKNFL